MIALRTMRLALPFGILLSVAASPALLAADESGTKRVPDFSGGWRGKIIAVSASQDQHELPVDVVIRQTWSAMEVRGKTIHGVTRSKLVGVRVDDEELRYEYETQPDIFDPTAKHHTGFCVLELLENDLLEGHYYTLDGTSAKGSIKLERQHLPR